MHLNFTVYVSPPSHLPISIYILEQKKKKQEKGKGEICVQVEQQTLKVKKEENKSEEWLLT